MNTLTHNCPFCQQEMSVEAFEMVAQYTCRNGSCRAYAITLTWAAWGAMTPEKLETYPRQYAHETTEDFARPDDAMIALFSTEEMGSKTVLVVTFIKGEKCHTVDRQSDIDRYAAMYTAQGYTVQMAVQS